METNYTFKRLKLFGTVFAALFAVLLLSSFKAESQTVTISGSSEICLAEGGTLATYTAAVTGGSTGPFFYAWSRSAAFGNFESGQADNTTSILWTEPSCPADGGPAWVQVVVTDGGAGGAQYQSDKFWVNTYDPLPEPTPLEPFYFCEDADVMAIDAPEDFSCNETGQWKSDPPGNVFFEDEYAFSTTIIGVGGNTNVFTPGTYTITWTLSNDDISLGACAPTTVTTTMTIYTKPTVSIDEDSEIELCFEETVELTALGVQAESLDLEYQWYKDDVAIVDATSSTYLVTETGVYHAVVNTYDPIECVSEPSNTVTVTISDLEAVVINDGVDIEICANLDFNEELEANVTGEGAGTLNYQWYYEGAPITVDGNGATYFADAFGTYSVTVTDVMGTISCTVSATINIIALDVPDPAIAVSNVCEEEIVEASVSGDYFGVDPVYYWSLIGEDNVFANTDAITIEGLLAGTYTLVVTVTNDDGCIGVATETFEVHPLPSATITGLDEICYNETTQLGLDPTADFGSVHTVTWYVDEVEAYVGDDFLFEGEVYGTETETVSVIVSAIVENEWGCYTTLADFEVTILGLPFITKNEILPPLYEGEVKTVWCTEVPAGLVIRGEDDVEWYPYYEDCDPIYRWRKSVDGGVTWQSTGDAADIGRHYILPRLTVTTWYKRQVMLEDCTCDAGDEDWVDSNIIEMVVVPADYFMADAGLDQVVCYDGTITLDANEAPMYSTGVWSEVEGITFSNFNDPMAEITAALPGEYVLTWTIIQGDIVAGCGDNDYDQVTVVFEELLVDELDLAYDLVCLDQDPFELDVPEITVTPAGTYTYVFSGDGVADGWFDPEAAGVGEHTIYFEVTTDLAECVVTVSATVTVFEKPDAPVTEAVVVCYDGEAHGFNVYPASVGYELLYWVDDVWTTVSPTYTEAGVYTVTAIYKAEAAPYCESDETIAYLTINPLPVIYDVAITSENTCYGEDIEITVDHTEGAVLGGWQLEGADGIIYPSAPAGPVKDAHLYSSVIGFAGEELAIGTYTLTVTVDYDYGDRNICTSEEYTFVFTVTPPVYAMFSPFYMKDDSGNIIDIDYVQDDGTPERINIPVTVADDGGLFVEFSDLVTNEAGLLLPDVDQGEFIILEKDVEGIWVRVDIRVTYEGNKAIVKPYDFSTDEAVDLEWETTYRLRHDNVYKSSCGEGLVEYRLDQIDDMDGGYEYDEWNTLAYEFDNEVIFTTMPIEYAHLPYVYPIGDDDRCSTIEVIFQNPVKYRTGQYITEDGDPTFKFELQKYDGGWVKVDIIDFVETDDFEFIEGAIGGPKHMIIHLTEEMEYGMSYQIAMTPANIGSDDDPVYGFTDIVLDVPVLDVPVDFSTMNTGINGGWSWSTSPNFEMIVDVDLPNPEFGTRPDNTYNVMVDGDWVISYPLLGPVTDTYYGIEKDIEFSVPAAGSAFTIAAYDSYNNAAYEGYHFAHWSLNGIDQRVAARPDMGDVNGEDYFAKSFQFNPPFFAPECEEEVVFKAHFDINTYDVTAAAVEEDWGTVKIMVDGVEVDGEDLEHGTEVSITAVPNAGYYFTGWDYESLPGIITTTGPDAADLPYLLDPVDYTSTLTFQLVGPLTNGDSWHVDALFAVFTPKIYAAAQGIDKDGETIHSNITNIEFKTLFVANIQSTGVEPKSELPDVNNFYEWAVFKYGNPTYESDDDHSNVTVRPLEVPCEYTPVKWERWEPSYPLDGGSWVELEFIAETGEFVFTPTENYRLRATFEWREDVMVSVDNDTRVVEDEMAMGSFLVELGETSWFNQSDPKAFMPGDELIITVFPEPDYLTYGWVNEHEEAIPVFDEEDYHLGGFVMDETYPRRYEDRTEWKYIVGCESEDLRAVIGKKRYFAEATVSPEDGGYVWNSTPGIQEGTAYGYGFWPEDTDLGFFHDEDLDGQYASGYFEINTEATFVADAAEDFAFMYWTEGGSWRSANASYVRNMVADVRLVAHFRSTIVIPTYAVTLLDEPAGAALDLSGEGMFEAGVTVTVSTYPEPGYDFVSWTDEEGDVVTTTHTFEFEMPEEDVTLVANFEMTEYELDMITRTYLRKEGVNSHPYTNEPYVIGEELPAAVYGGNVYDLTDGEHYVFGDIVSLRAVPNPGFRLVNWMVGEVTDEYNEIFTGRQVNPANGVTVYPGTQEFTYEIPAQYGETVKIYAIFAEATHPMYPVYAVNTLASPAGFGETFGTGHYAHGVVAEISENVTEPGYEFSHWTTSTPAALLDGSSASPNHLNMVYGNQTATAHYTAIHYDLYVQAVNGYGDIDLPLENPTNYTVEDTPIAIETTPNETAVGDGGFEWEYVFTGWSYDYQGLKPVVDALGNEITDPEFFFIPIVPEDHMSDNSSYDVTIYAQYIRIPRGFEITLLTALNDYTNIDPVVGTAWVVDETAPYVFPVGTELEIMTEANAGYAFKRWTNEAGTTIVLVPPFNHTVIDEDETFIAVYEHIDYELELVAVPAEGGALAAVPAQSFYNINDEVTVTATPAAGYAFTGFAEPLPAGAVVEGNEVSFVWGADDVTITGHFELITYDVTFVVTDDEDAAVADAVVTLDGVTNDAGDYVFADLLPGTYFYTVTLEGFLPIEGEVVITDEDVTVYVSFAECPAPTGLAAVVTAKTALITWNEGDDDMWWVRVNGGDWTPVTATERFYTGLMPGTDYVYEVATVCGEGVVSDPAVLEFTTIQMGDVNGDGDNMSIVNLTLMIAYINGDIDEEYVIMDARDYDGQTSVFIFDAADFNADHKINVLDIVSWVNQTMEDDAAKADLRSNPADIYLAPGLISLNSDGTLAGIEFELKGRNLDQVNLEMLLAGYELTWRVDGDILTAIVYSHNNKPINEGLVEMISVSGGQDVAWAGAFGANLNASLVDVRTHGNITTGIEDLLVQMTMEAFPNPSTGQFTTRISTPTSSDVVLRLYDMTGRQISVKQLVVNGQESVVWNEDLRTGMYIMRMIATPENQRDQSVTREVRILINK